MGSRGSPLSSEAKKAKSVERRKYERSCFVHGSIFLKFKNENIRKYLILIFSIVRYFNFDKNILNDLSIKIIEKPKIKTKDELEKALSDDKNKRSNDNYKIVSGKIFILKDGFIDYYLEEKVAIKINNQISSSEYVTYLVNNTTNEKIYLGVNENDWHRELE